DLGVLAMNHDTRLSPTTWSAKRPDRRHRVGARLLLCAIIPLALIYFAWLLQPGRVGEPVLYALLVGAELFNLAQAAGFWWPCAGDRPGPPLRGNGAPAHVDVFIPVYDEPPAVVEPTVAAATRLTGVEARVHLLDDGDSRQMRAIAISHGVDYIRRD